MNIKILKNGLKKDEVWFTSDCGEGRGIWCGPPVTPDTGHEAELEVTGLLMNWVDILPADHDGCGMRMEGETVVLSGILENIEEDGTAYLRLCEELVMFECLGEPMALGGYVEIRTREIRLYPFSL